MKHSRLTNSFCNTKTAEPTGLEPTILRHTDSGAHPNPCGRAQCRPVIQSKSNRSDALARDAERLGPSEWVAQVLALPNPATRPEATREPYPALWQPFVKARARKATWSGRQHWSAIWSGC